jgi:sugar lactone lactonase YvrE
MALFGPDDAQQLLVVSRDSQARVIDPRSDTTLPVSLPFNAEHVRLFEAAAPGDSQSRPRALLYGDKNQTVVFMELQSLNGRRERKLETLQLPAEVKSLIEIDRPDTLVVVHDHSVTLLDLAQRTATPVAADETLANALFDAEHDRLWVATTSQSRVGTLDLAGGKTGELLLDAQVGSLVPFFDVGRLVVVHPSTVGYVTLIDTAMPDRKHARSLRGFLLSDILDREE